jgi:hypothetical protein
MNKSFLPANCAFLIAGFLIVAAGCSKAPYDTAAVQGTVTLDGQPLSKGKVMFAPVAASGSAKVGKPGFGQVNAEGRFIVSTYGKEDGAVVGTHWVTVIQTIVPNNSHATPDTAESVQFIHYKFPQQQTVAAGSENKIDIALTSAMLSE